MKKVQDPEWQQVGRHCVWLVRDLLLSAAASHQPTLAMYSISSISGGSTSRAYAMISAYQTMVEQNAAAKQKSSSGDSSRDSGIAEIRTVDRPSSSPAVSKLQSDAIVNSAAIALHILPSQIAKVDVSAMGSVHVVGAVDKTELVRLEATLQGNTEFLRLRREMEAESLADAEYPSRLMTVA